ncbi:hypothetical protein [Carnobacterium maltaromaticum]|uniref:hypothetical protein n=1 Tax=Carnobacterium maltaromaticum TaxID=2751 RepID=UPI0039BE62E7
MSAKYYVRVGNIYFKNWGESGIEPTFVLPDQIGWERYSFRFEDERLAENIAKQLGGVVVLLSEELLESCNPNDVETKLYDEGHLILGNEEESGFVSDLRRRVTKKVVK